MFLLFTAICFNLKIFFYLVQYIVCLYVKLEFHIIKFHHHCKYREEETTSRRFLIKKERRGEREIKRVKGRGYDFSSIRAYILISNPSKSKWQILQTLKLQTHQQKQITDVVVSRVRWRLIRFDPRITVHTYSLRFTVTSSDWREYV